MDRPTLAKQGQNRVPPYFTLSGTFLVEMHIELLL